MNKTQRAEQALASVLTKKQTRQWSRVYTEHGTTYRITATARYDDECNNGHNTFALTADIHEKKGNGLWYWSRGGCCHEEIAKRFPTLAPLIKWHLCDSTGPMYYIANTVYLAGDGEGKARELDAARSTAIWPDATDAELTAPGLEERLTARLPALLREFRAAMESLGFVF